MKSIFCTVLIAVIVSVGSFAQNNDTTYWTRSSQVGINFNQASFNKNWKGGGNNSLAMGVVFFAKAGYQKNKLNWDNLLDLQYSVLKNEGQNARKSNDKFLFDSKLGYQISNNWNVFTSLNFLTQFDDGYDYDTDENGAEVRTQISGFMAPAFITSSWGAEYKPNEYFNLRLAPFSPRITLVTDTALYYQIPENYGVKQGEKVRYEWFAFRLAAGFDKDIYEGVNLKASYDFFANYKELEAKKFDHRLELAISTKIYKILHVGINSILLYDYDQTDKVQASFSTAVSVVFDF